VALRPFDAPQQVAEIIGHRDVMPERDKHFLIPLLARVLLHDEADVIKQQVVQPVRPAAVSFGRDDVPV